MVRTDGVRYSVSASLPTGVAVAWFPVLMEGYGGDTLARACPGVSSEMDQGYGIGGLG